MSRSLTPTPRFFRDNFLTTELFLMFLGALNAPVVCASFRSEIIEKYSFFEKLQLIYYLSRKKLMQLLQNKNNSKFSKFQKSLFRKKSDFSKISRFRRYRKIQNVKVFENWFVFRPKKNQKTICCKDFFIHHLLK